MISGRRPSFRFISIAMVLAAGVSAGCAVSGGAPRRRAGSRVGGVEIAVVVAEGKAAESAQAGNFRGDLEIVEIGGRKAAVNRVSLEDYVKGVLPGEVSPSWPPEALKAMAVVARSYAWSKLDAAGDGRPRNGKYHLLSDVRDQCYCGLACEDGRSNAAAEETEGLVLFHGGRAFCSFNHSCCGGATEDVREVWGGPRNTPLGGVDCRWCRSSAHYGPWILIIDKAALGRRLKPVLGGGPVRKVEIMGTTGSGRAGPVRVASEAREAVVTAAKLREMIGYNDLRSARFEVWDRGEEFEFRGKGWGHGVGLCQEGARAMAENGYGWREIVETYFPGVEIGRAKR